MRNGWLRNTKRWVRGITVHAHKLNYYHLKFPCRLFLQRVSVTHKRLMFFVSFCWKTDSFFGLTNVVSSSSLSLISGSVTYSSSPSATLLATAGTFSCCILSPLCTVHLWTGHGLPLWAPLVIWLISDVILVSVCSVCYRNFSYAVQGAQCGHWQWRMCVFGGWHCF